MIPIELHNAACDAVDPQLLANLEDLELIAHVVVEGFLHGLHRSPYVGFSVEFASHREYLRGDDLRHLNWKLYARQDKLYVKQYDADTNLDLHLVVDWSGSMTTASDKPSKHRYATWLATALAHLALGQRDAVGLTLFADEILAHIKPRARPHQWTELIDAFVHTAQQPHGESVGVLHDVAELMPRRGMIILISDLFYETTELFSAVDHLRFQGHEVLTFQILDPMEIRLPPESNVRFHDLETGEKLVTQTENIRVAYERAVEQWLQELDDGFLTRELERVSLTTDEPLDRALSDYLARRAGHF